MGDELVALAVSFGEEAATVQKYVSDRGFRDFVIGLDREGRSTGLYQVVLRPTAFVVDRAGVIRQALAGPVNADQWGRELAPLLRK